MTQYQKRFDDLVRTINEYESDTFSASASKITISEAIKMADNITCYHLQQMIDGNTMDGLIIAEELSNIRD